MDHSLRCTYAAGDLRAHGQLILEELPCDLNEVIGEYLYDQVEVDAVSAVKAIVAEFFDGGHWSGSLLPTRDDPRWTHLMTASENARAALILNGLPGWKENASHRKTE